MTQRLLSLGFIACLALPAAAQTGGDFHWDKALPAGNEVSIHNINGDIKVTPSTTGRVSIVGIKRGSGRDFDRIKAEVQETSHGIVVCVVREDVDSYCDDRGVHMHGDHDWNNVRMDLEVAIPANLTVSAGSVSGNVAITGANGDVEATSVSGDIRLARLHASSVNAHTVSGDVEVQVDAFTGRGDLSFKSVSGDVTLEVPNGFDADISMSTVSGDMNSDFPVTLGNGRMSHRRIEARIGNGGRRLDVSTVSGSLRLKKAK
jgi:hypothetical protein